MSTITNKGPQEPFLHGGMLEAIQTFNTEGAEYPRILLCEEFLKACDHVVYLFNHYGPFWEKLDVNEIDMSDPDTSLYDVVLRELGLSISQISLETYYKRTNLLMVQLSHEITRVMNHFFRYLLRKLQANSVLVTT